MGGVLINVLIICIGIYGTTASVKVVCWVVAEKCFLVNCPSVELAWFVQFV